MLEAIKRDGVVKNLSWETGEDVMNWWISDVMTLQGQTTFDGFDILDV